MRKLIYLDDAIDAILHRLGVKDESCLLPSEKAIVEILKEMPSINLTECEKCKYYVPFGSFGASGYCSLHYKSNKAKRLSMACDFCSWAKSKEAQRVKDKE